MGRSRGWGWQDFHGTQACTRMHPPKGGFNGGYHENGGHTSLYMRLAEHLL